MFGKWQESIQGLFRERANEKWASLTSLTCRIRNIHTSRPTTAMTMRFPMCRPQVTCDAIIAYLSCLRFTRTILMNGYGNLFVFIPKCRGRWTPQLTMRKKKGAKESGLNQDLSLILGRWNHLGKLSSHTPYSVTWYWNLIWNERTNEPTNERTSFCWWLVNSNISRQLQSFLTIEILPAAQLWINVRVFHCPNFILQYEGLFFRWTFNLPVTADSGNEQLYSTGVFIVLLFNH